MISDLSDALLHQDLDEFVKTLPKKKIGTKDGLYPRFAARAHTFVRVARDGARKMGLVELTPWKKGCIMLTTSSSSWLPKYLADKHHIPYLLIVDSWED